MGKKMDEGKILLKTAPSSHKESSSSAGHFYLSAGKHMENSMKTALYFLGQENLYALIIPKSVEHVPKV